MVEVDVEEEEAGKRVRRGGGNSQRGGWFTLLCKKHSLHSRCVFCGLKSQNPEIWRGGIRLFCVAYFLATRAALPL